MAKSYHRIIRKMVVAFGDLFNSIELVRYDTNGEEQQRQKVPLAYAPKERYVMRLQSDPELDKKVQITLPRMSFELNGLSYDASRKQITNIKNFALSNDPDTLLQQYNPVPYDFDFSLYIYVRNIEDGTQIIERILPFFTPDYTIKLNLIPEMGIVKEVPVVLKSTDYEITYEGPREQETRTIIWTLNFTVKGFIYGAIQEKGSIKATITNIYDDPNLGKQNFDFVMNSGGVGNFKEGEYVYQGYTIDTSTASARVISWNADTLNLRVNQLAGNFVANTVVYGKSTGSAFILNSGGIGSPIKLVTIEVEPNPNTANANSNYTYETNIINWTE